MASACHLHLETGKEVRISVRFDHLLVAARDNYHLARFVAEIPGLSESKEARFVVPIRRSPARELLVTS